MPPDAARKHGVKLDQAAPIASPNELGDYDAILFGTPTRFGNMAAQMRTFLDQTGGLWVKGGRVPIDWLYAAFEFINVTDEANADTMAAMKQEPTATSVKSATLARNALQWCLLLALSLFLSACKQDGNIAKGKDFTGVYTLETVNGNKVPATVSHDGTALQVRSGAFTINADGTCGSRMVFVPPSGVEATREVSATYTREGPKLTMQWKDAGTTTGTLEGDTFTMDNEGMVFAYRK
jgi:hypothetical protein